MSNATTPAIDARDVELDALQQQMMHACAHADIYGGQDRRDACDRARAAYYARKVALAEGGE